MPATEQPCVLRVLSGYRHPTGRRAGHAVARVLPVLPLRFLRVLMFKSSQIIPKGQCETGNRKSSSGAKGESMKDDKRLAGPRRLRQPFWLGHGPDGTKWGAGVNYE